MKVLNNKGFTLIEVITVSGIIAGLAIVALYLTSSTLMNKASVQAKMSNTNIVPGIIGRTVQQLRVWNGNINDLQTAFENMSVTSNQEFSIFTGTSSINTIVGANTISSCQLTSSGNKLSFCLFSTNSSPIKIDGMIVSARVMRFEIELLDMRNQDPITVAQFTGSSLSGGKAKYRLKTWTKVKTKNVINTISGAIYFAK